MKRTKTFFVEGMTCTGCEGRIQRILEKQEGVLHVQADYGKATLTVEYDENKIDPKVMSNVLAEQEYQLQPMLDEQRLEKEFGKGEAIRGGANPARDSSLSLFQFAAISILIVALYIIIKYTVGFNILPEVQSSMGFAALFVVGLLTSLHCVAMCGGLAVSQCVAAADTQKRISGQSKTGLTTLRTSLLYNGGRVISYTIIGGLVGALGSAVSFSGWARGLVAIASGIFMIIMAINLLGVLPSLRRLMPRMPAPLRRFSMNFGRGKSPLVVGLLNGLMPCGPLQGMQLYALGTGSALVGAASMFFFSLGTAPLLIGLGSATSLIGGKLTAKMMKISALVILALGFVMISRGFALSGIPWI
jgi:uncharacterized protein